MSAPTKESIRRNLPLLVAVAFFMETLDATIVNTAVPVMAQNLQVEPLALKTVMTSYTLSLAVFIPISGWMADRFGTRRVFFIAVGLFAFGSLLCGLAPDVPFLVAARILQGMGGAMMTPVGRIVLVRSFPRGELIRMMNYVIIPALVGPMIGPFLGGLIVEWFSWRIIFFVNIPFALLGLWFVHRIMPDYREPKVKPLDRVGFLLFGSGIALLSYVLEVFGEHSHPAAKLSLLTAIALLLLALYGWHSRRSKSPMLTLRLFGLRTFRLAVLGGFFTRVGVGGMPFLLPLLYQIGLGYAPWQAGLLTMPSAAAAIVMKIASTKLLRLFGHRNILMVNTLILALVITLFTQIGIGAPLWAIITLSLSQGCCMSLQFTGMGSLTYADVDNRDASQASSIASTSQQLSFSFGIAFASLVAGYFLKGLDQTEPVVVIPALHYTFVIMGALVVLSSIIYWWLHRDDGNNVSNRVPRIERPSAISS